MLTVGNCVLQLVNCWWLSHRGRIVSCQGYSLSPNSLKIILSLFDSSVNQMSLINQSISLPSPVKYQKQKYNFFFFSNTEILFLLFIGCIILVWGNLRYIYDFCGSKNYFKNQISERFTWKTNSIWHEVSLQRSCYMWWHWLLKIEMKWGEANTNMHETLLSLNDTKNSIYLIISVMPTGELSSRNIVQGCFLIAGNPSTKPYATDIST